MNGKKLASHANRRVSRRKAAMLSAQRCACCGASLAHLPPIPGRTERLLTVLMRASLEDHAPTAAEVAAVLGVTLRTAERYLTEAFDLRLVERRRRARAGGGDLYRYVPTAPAMSYVREDGLARAFAARAGYRFSTTVTE